MAAPWARTFEANASSPGPEIGLAEDFHDRRYPMRQLLYVGMVVVLPLLLLAAPVGASEEVLTSPAPATFHALRRLPAAEGAALTPMTDADLAATAGAIGPLNIGLNLAVVTQVNVCGLCVGVQQRNVGGSFQNLHF